MRVGLGLQTGLPARELISHALKAEDKGFNSVWVSEDPFFRDALPILGSIAYNTNKIRLASCIVNVYTKNPVYMAMFALTMSELSENRFVLGIGRGLRSVIEGQLGIEYHKPLEYVREYLAALKSLLRGESSFSGRYFKLRDARFFFKPPDGAHPRILLAAMGPRMLKLAGELADGAILNSCTSTKYAEWAVGVVRESAKNAGKEDDVEVACSIWTCVSDDVDNALKTLKLPVGFLTSIPGFGELLLQHGGLSINILEELRSAYRWSEPHNDPFWHLENADKDKVMELIDDKMVDALTVCGDAEYCARRVREYMRAGITTPILFPIGCSVDAVMGLAEWLR